MGKLLDSIDSPQDLKILSLEELDRLADEIRQLLISFCRRHGGHLGSNLATIEPIIALHYVFDMPHDHLIFDVSHQAYTHKILTGRRRAYTDPESQEDLSGFTSPKESPYDDFMLGHTGTSIGLACGMAAQRDATGGRANIIAFIGDGSLSSGPAFEGLDWAAEQGGNLIIVVNDNEMSIAENHGGLYKSLAALRASGGRNPNNPFRALGLDYRYVEEGNRIEDLIEAFRQVKDTDHPVVVHIHTRKGLGLSQGSQGQIGPTSLPDLPAEGPVEANHWQDGLDSLNRLPNSRKTYGRMAMQALEARFPQEPGLTVISPATPLSNGIDPDFRQRAGNHYRDVGIAESHAIAYAAGIAKAGGTPVVATSATFFQRAYDQIEQEMALNGSAVTLLVFSTGVAKTDATHSGTADMVMMRGIPGLTCLAPTSGAEFLDMLAWATGPARQPVVIRVPGERTLATERAGKPIAPATSDPTSGGQPWDRYRILQQGRTVALLALGDALPLGHDLADSLERSTGLKPTLVDPHRYDRLDKQTLDALASTHSLVVTIEDGQLDSGWGQAVAAYYGPAQVRTLSFGAAKEFNDRVPQATLLERYGMTVPAMTQAISDALVDRAS
ncbi:1-deoxy-D-xylulose-5-phosphate synthase [Bifidobacterium sp. B4107]|uniref:1-deoxy-D-xylulose-5-phosphate synthase n=1 Tax=unclassified Bifidobacterium TaxID=2608897 RepID=UPI00226B0498|nr:MULTISPECIES: 1-deoxy-D-xylulose-5-phosphate synthase [unclassified Bifidobacterium]MCX8647148.1 1-deoxy-D-xylulose-5-phosphate synthase [Bifidobacterium sp. B4107]MCX8651328.1 1-deoxy-D-xylulose-5-phosphate synthase [Bifidobacterium sp. B4111]MCX8657758.1 1-deoxy-D-xylulose-5-phosphate synthase [Bifidobacterium sp. B4114]